MVPSESTLKSGRRLAMIGNPNTGKSTLFNTLTGLQARVGNFPGCTVEKKVGKLHFEQHTVELIDLPGTYSLSPRTPDEMVSVDVLLGRQQDVGELDGVVCIVDASNLERNFYLLSQLLDLQMPVILVLNMWDVAQARHVSIDVEGLRQRLRIPIIVCEAHRKMGVDDVRRAIIHPEQIVSPNQPKPFQKEFYEECSMLSKSLARKGEKALSFYVVERLLIDVGGQAETDFVEKHGDALLTELTAARDRLKEAGCRLPIAEAKARYAWARETLKGLVHVPAKQAKTRSDRIDHLLTHRTFGLVFFAALMFVIFQALYTWSGPLMDLVEAGQTYVSDQVASRVPPGSLRSLLVDGVVAGVGGVLIFLPQIALLFLFIAILEDCGYMARAAFVMDRLMTKVGLSGKSFVPLMSSFACAIPGVMATRVIENRRDRMVTILVAPLMSCSARLPVYILLVAFLPQIKYFDGWVSLQGLVLFAMYSLGAVIAVPVAWILKKTFFKGETPPFVMELPSYKRPSPRIVFARVYDRSKAFVIRAGTLIFCTSILVWAAGYFPGDREPLHTLEGQIEVTATKLEAAPADSSLRKQLTELSEKQNALSASLIEESWLGQGGHSVEPAVRPLGRDWKVGVRALASFPARAGIAAPPGPLSSPARQVGACRACQAGAPPPAP
ncbi:MAG: ferrous iron transport protein B, partial [Planctomycetes bacterium]|nr:ferrous iron transport protein B [Planctomycetota bacterium]